MKVKIVRRVFSLCCAAIFVLLLTGCDPTAGATVYEVNYKMIDNFFAYLKIMIEQHR